MIPTALYTELATLVDNRCYPIKLPERAIFPAITYFQVSGIDNNTHDGYDGTFGARWQISCWGNTYGSAKVLANAVKLALRTFDGSLTQIVSKSTMENETDFYEPDVKLYHVPVDFYFLIKEV